MNQENKQTAVEWLEKNIKLDMSSFEIIELFNEALEIEKKQIEEAFEHIDFNLDNGEAYYEKMYKNGK
jgi:uncharacterized protein YoaH (UPF0181 family)